MLQLKNVTKAYNGTPVINIPDLALGPSVYWLKGANGSGKTTLLKLIAGLLPFQGNISFNGTDLLKQPLRYRNNISWSEAEPLYPPELTGAEMVSLYQRIRKASATETRSLLAAFQLDAFINNAIGSYSAGMTKKLSLMLAFIGNPSLIILDEPLITLDENSFAFVSDLIIQKSQQDGITFLMSSHQQPEATLLLAGRELLLTGGNITIL